MIPIFSANKIQSDDIIVGYCYQPTHFIDDGLNIICHTTYETFKVDKETLKISFDCGKSFIKLSDLEVHTCTDFKLEYTNMQMNNRKDVQPPNGSIFTIITDKGR